MNDLIVQIPERAFYALPSPTIELIWLYSGRRCLVRPGDVLEFVLPADRWHEITAAAEVLGGKIGPCATAPK